MKPCPKCNDFHSKPGIYCSLLCANRSKRTWNKGLTKETDNRLVKMAEKLKAKGSSWNKGLTKETDQRVLNNSIALKNHIGCVHSKTTKQRLSASAKERKLGGYIKGSGRGKSGWYKGFWCDSSYELAYVIWALDHNIPINRNILRFPFTYKGKIKFYIPDFIRLDRKDYFIEVKGYFSDETIEKTKQFPHKLKIYCGNGMKKFLKYAKEKHGKNFIELYDLESSAGWSATSLES